MHSVSGGHIPYIPIDVTANPAIIDQDKDSRSKPKEDDTIKEEDNRMCLPRLKNAFRPAYTMTSRKKQDNIKKEGTNVKQNEDDSARLIIEGVS